MRFRLEEPQRLEICHQSFTVHPGSSSPNHNGHDLQNNSQAKDPHLNKDGVGLPSAERAVPVDIDPKSDDDHTCSGQ
ncbi:MAG TPA: hypothetical protein DCM86_11750 [Verrucomicrobiales bacterium]|nr:hypothetical protein [Verrucomicrobiales bacterium]